MVDGLESDALFPQQLAVQSWTAQVSALKDKGQHAEGLCFIKPSISFSIMGINLYH